MAPAHKKTVSICFDPCSQVNWKLFSAKIIKQTTVTFAAKESIQCLFCSSKIVTSCVKPREESLKRCKFPLTLRWQLKLNFKTLSNDLHCKFWTISNALKLQPSSSLFAIPKITKIILNSKLWNSYNHRSHLLWIFKDQIPLSYPRKTNDLSGIL